MFQDDLSGRGAEIAGGRWNTRGNALLYTAENRALCTAEIAVHTPLGIVPQDYMLLSIKIPADLSIMEISVDELADNWRMFPHPTSTKEVGDSFIRAQKAPILRVPSAIVTGEHNLLINPRHPDAATIELEEATPFTFDERLFLK